MSQSFDTINTRFAEAARKYPDRPALSSKPHGSKAWETLTYQDLAARVAAAGTVRSRSRRGPSGRG